MDWSKLENIIFVAVAAFLAVFLLIVTFVIIAKGKRRRTAADILLRVFAYLLFIFLAGLFACAVFTMLTGKLRIVTDAEAETAVFVAGDSITKLPLPVIFHTLSQSIGQMIVAVLLLLDFVVMVADGLLAHKRYGDSSAKKQKKDTRTPEQIKRDAELEKIRKLGDAAVKKSAAAADTDGKSTVTDKKEEPQEDKPEQDEPQPKEENEEEESFDWRVQSSPTQKKAEFVGISDNGGDKDDFKDDFDAPFDEEPAQKAQEEKPWYEQDEPQTDSIEDEDTKAEDEPEESGEDERPWYEQDEPEEKPEEKPEDERPWYEQGNDEPEQAKEDTEPEQPEEETDEIPWYAQGGESEAVYDDDTEQPEEEPEPEPEQPEEEAYDDGYDDGIEPDRQIYIPKIRTVTRRVPVEKPAAKKPEEKKPAAKRPAAKKPAAKKPVAKKPAAKKAPAKKAPVKKAPAKKTETKQAEPETGVYDKKKLPVNRRYVILDRKNAVNIFSDYLKERDKADKAKLESSINTIIIK